MSDYPRPVVAVATPGFRHDLRPDVRFVRLSTADRWPDWLWRVFRDRRGAPLDRALFYGEWPPEGPT